MRCLKLWFIPILMLLTLLQSYPQKLLISSKDKEGFIINSIVDKVYKSKSKYLDINVTVPQIEGMTNENTQREVNNSIVTWTEDWIKEVQEVVNQYFDNGVPPLNPYKLYATYTVTNLDKVSSFYIDYYQFTGGAHGITIRRAYSVDNLSGKVLNLKDLFVNEYDYKTSIDKDINMKICKEPDKYFLGKDGFNGIDENTKFYIKDNMLVIYYGQYEIAPYVAGIPEFYIGEDVFDGNFIYGKI